MSREALSTQFRTLAECRAKCSQTRERRAALAAAGRRSTSSTRRRSSHMPRSNRRTALRGADTRCEYGRPAADADVWLASGCGRARHPARIGVDADDPHRRRLRAAADVGLRGGSRVRVSRRSARRCRWCGPVRTTCGTTITGPPGSITSAPAWTRRTSERVASPSGRRSRNRYRLGDTPPESTEIYGLMAPPASDPAKSSSTTISSRRSSRTAASNTPKRDRRCRPARCARRRTTSTRS